MDASDQVLKFEQVFHLFFSSKGQYNVKTFIIFTVPARMSLTKLSQVRNNLILPGQGEFG
jgi:hypothetical protein